MTNVLLIIVWVQGRPYKPGSHHEVTIKPVQQQMRMVMKILHVVNAHDVGGATTQVSALIQSQKERHDVSVLAFGDGKIIKFLKTIDVPAVTISMRVSGLKKGLKVIKAANREGAVVHAHGLKPMFLCALLGPKRLNHMVATLHSDYHYEYNNKPLKKMMAIPIMKWSLLKMHQIVAVSDDFIRVLVQDGVEANRCLYIPNGLNLDQIHPDKGRAALLKKIGLPDQGEVLLGMASRLHAVKGIEMLIRATYLLKDENIRIFVAGTGEPEQVKSYQNLINDLGLSNRIFLMGFVEDVYNFYNGLDINLLTSVSEGVSYSVMEAGALAKPIVCTAVSGMKLLVEDRIDGLMVPIGDGEQFAKAVKEMVANEPLRKQLGQALQKKVLEAYGHHTMAKRYEHFYQHYRNRNEEKS